MKTILIITIALFTFTAYAQIPGNKIPGPILVQDSILVNAGDVLKLGTGSDPRSGDFVFIYYPANAFIGTAERQYENSYANTTLRIKFFKQFENRKVGKKTFTVADAPGMNAVIELDAAIKAGEVIAINDNDVSLKQKQSTPTVSVADELEKLKKLRDEGAISEDDYQTMKSKLINN